MKKAFCLFLLGIFSTFILAALPRIAVLEAVISGEVDPNLSVAVIETLSETLVTSGKLTVLDRTTVNQSFKEVEFQLSGLVNENQVRQIGEIVGSRLGAEYVLITQISKIESTYFISAKLIDIVTGEIIVQDIEATEGGVGSVLQAAESIGIKITGEWEDPPWNEFVGTWKVISKPTGWNDYQYTFSSEGYMDIYHRSSGKREIVFRGRIIEMDDFTILCESQPGFVAHISDAVTVYYESLSNNRMRIGWGNGFPVEIERP